MRKEELVEGTEHDGHLGVLRFDCGGDNEDLALQPADGPVPGSKFGRGHRGEVPDASPRGLGYPGRCAGFSVEDCVGTTRLPAGSMTGGRSGGMDGGSFRWKHVFRPLLVRVLLR